MRKMQPAYPGSRVKKARSRFTGLARLPYDSKLLFNSILLQSRDLGIYSYSYSKLLIHEKTVQRNKMKFSYYTRI